jgi:ParB-like chromosome segregation protein Spo0J
MEYGEFNAIVAALGPMLSEGSLEQRINRLNTIRRAIHDSGPFAEQPVDYVEWVAIDEVVANDYNPNTVAPPEMSLLKISIDADGFTQPIVTNREGELREVVDGFHRNRIGRENEEIRERLHGYLPVVQIRNDRADRGDRIASTIRHNRARGKHRITGMSDIVLELRRRNWSESKIGRELGMDPDEVLRLAQITGLAEMFANRDFSEAWEVSDSATIDQDDDLELVGEDVLDGRPQR